MTNNSQYYDHLSAIIKHNRSITSMSLIGESSYDKMIVYQLIKVLSALNDNTVLKELTLEVNKVY
jgi:hypothetical protein